MKIKKRSMFISLLPLLLLVGAAYADTVSNVIIPIQGCNAEDNAAAAGTFGGVCDFPDGSALISDDGNVETHSADRSGTRYWGGVNTTSYNSSETECIAITSVMVCYEWWSSTTGQDCDVSVDADGGASYTAITTTCPGTTPNPRVVCYNATATESWSCSNFFGASGTRARIKSEGRKSGGNGAQTYTWDVLYFNVTYKRDREAPNVTLIAPPNGTTLYSNNVLFQYNVSDESAIANCSLIINGVVNQTNTTVTRNVTQNFTATLGAGNYNWSVNCTDNSTNKNQGSSATW
ncbi:MAG: Ig-like domain-containing protein, partial [Candidatus Micrarchaeia archaeon]